MVRTKLSPRGGKKAAKQSVPESADDFQALADEEESRGGKWRAGDPAKSARAFERAVTLYDQGLAQYPDNFDLAYNKARLQLEVSQQSALLPHWGLSQGDFLAQTLLSHRKALTISDDDVDLLFNTAQVLTSLAEELSEQDEAQAIPLLHEALELLSSCLARQEMLLEQQSADVPDDEDDGGVSLAQPTSTSATSERQEESATIIQPIVPSDLVDTVHASLSALTTLVALVDGTALTNLENMAHSLHEEKAPSYLALMPPDEVDSPRFVMALDRANFICALANARFNAHDIDLRTLVASIDSFNVPDKSSHADILSAEAAARTEVVLSALEQSEAGQDISVLECWRQSALAQEGLSQAVKLNNDDAKELKARMYRQKGDVELSRIRIASLPSPDISDAVRNSRTTLLKNSRTYFKGAIGHSASLDDAETQAIAETRLKAVDLLIDLDSNSQPLVTDDLPEIMSDLVDEGLVGASIMDRISTMLS
ncbi:hypothetical protein AMS68_003338 [Peltaster fructicola]|uniref:Uncharacterized protein n=1 Tax=Peltaster fructicola TaxID=286661 RepID=A0A6H0XT29_9PEZI|nr:hypothetical protein AMS68_003338 [Peltaster fructicola]